MDSLGGLDGGLSLVGSLGRSGGGSVSGLGSAVGSVAVMGRSMSMNVLLHCLKRLLSLSHPTTTIDAGGGGKT